MPSKKFLTEAEYKDFFSKKTLNKLNQQTQTSRQQMLGNKSAMGAAGEQMNLLSQIMRAEKDYIDELEMVAVQIIKDHYPIVEYANIQINAKIGPLDMNVGDNYKMPDEEDKPQVPFVDIELDLPTPKEEMLFKRRITNAITQGSSIRGSFVFNLFREYLDAINPSLIQKYNDILKVTFGLFDDDQALAMFLAAVSEDEGIGGGGVKVNVGMKPMDDEEGEGEEEGGYEEPTQFTINAWAVCFPMLIHEIVKGIYEIVGTEAFGTDKAQNQAIVNKVDKVSHEPEDMRYGKFIYDAVVKLFNESPYNDSRIRELLFAEIYKMPDNDFFPFIENAINDELTSGQIRWANDIMRDIDSDLKKDDTGLPDL